MGLRCFCTPVQREMVPSTQGAESQGSAASVTSQHAKPHCQLLLTHCVDVASLCPTEAAGPFQVDRDLEGEGDEADSRAELARMSEQVIFMRHER